MSPGGSTLDSVVLAAGNGLIQGSSGRQLPDVSVVIPVTNPRISNWATVGNTAHPAPHPLPGYREI